MILNFLKGSHTVVEEDASDGELQWLSGIRLAFVRESSDTAILVNNGMQSIRTVVGRPSFGLHLNGRVAHLHLSILATFLHNFLLLLLLSV